MTDAILTATDIFTFQNSSMNPLSFECPVCGGKYDFTNVESEKLLNKKNKNLSFKSYKLTCPNKKCGSSFAFISLLQSVIDSGLPNETDYFKFLNVPNIDNFVPSFIQREYILAYELLSISPESAGVYVRKILESFVHTTWPETQEAKTVGKKQRRLSLFEKINWVFKKGLVSNEDKQVLDKVRNIFNASAHYETNSRDMSPIDVARGLNILMKIVRKYAFHVDVSSDEKSELGALESKYGMNN